MIKKIYLQNEDSHRELVQAIVEHAILNMGVPELEKIKEMLMKKYNLTTADALDYPECVKEILQDLFGNSYQAILNTMYMAFDQAMQEESIRKFMIVMEK